LENQPRTNDALRARLRWRCRRGARELDLLLSGFMDRGYTGLNDRERLVFEQLLDQPDDVLLALLTGRALAANSDTSDVIAKIQGAAANNP